MTSGALIKIHDGADEYRIEITGNFADKQVHDVDQCWRKALSENMHRKITVDISQISDYDRPGCKLLRKMHQHGTTIAAATPRSLIFLQEITASPRRGPALILETDNISKEVTHVQKDKAFATGK